MFPQTWQKPWVIRPVPLPPFVGQVNPSPPVSNDCSQTLVYGGGVNSRGQHHAKSRSSRETGRYRRANSSRRGVRIGIIVALVVVVGSTAWLGSRVLMVKGELEASQALVERLQTEATAFDLTALTQTSDELHERTARAAAGTRDVTWRIAEVVPFLGSNLFAVRAITESLDEIVDEVAVPGVQLASELSGGSDDSAGFSLEPISGLPALASTARAVLAESVERIDKVNTTTTIGAVTSVVERVDGVINDANEALISAGPAIDAAGDIVGTNGKRTYLLAFQNNAESTALGGSAASYTAMNVENGKIEIAAQANSGDFVEGVPVDVDVDQSALDIYGSYLVDHINTSTSRPDFPTAASIMNAFWERDQGSSVDGVISVDPLALALILNATGPITLPSGDVIDTNNAAALLTNGVYMRYPSNEEAPLADAFFAEAASTIINTIMAGDFDVPSMMTALTAAIDQGSVMAWSSHPDEQTLLDNTRIQGTLPATNDEATVMGVYFRDTSASKIDYYLLTDKATSSTVCSTPDNPTFTTSVTLQSSLTEQEADDLPQYVASRDWLGSKFRTEVFVYGPVGATITSAIVDKEGLGTVKTGEHDDLGRPVVSFAAFLAPGEVTTVTATFAGTPGSYGPLELRGTPMINPTTFGIDAPGC